MLRLILAASVTEPATAVSMAAVTFSEPACMSAARTLAVSACFFTNSRAASGTSRFWSLVNASVTGAKASLTVFSTELVSVVIGVSPSSGFELWAHPVRIGPGRDRCAIVNGATQHQCCSAISRIREQIDGWALCPEIRQKFHFSLMPGQAPSTLHGVVLRVFVRPVSGRSVFVRAVSGRSVLDRPWQPIGFHLGPHLRHIMPEHDDVVLLAIDVTDVVPQQGLGLETEAF